MDHAKVAELCTAAFNGNVGAVQTLLSQGVHASARDDTGMTPLHRASITGKVPVVSLLLSQGASPKERDIYGDTPLHYAAHCGNEAVARLLLDAGAEVNALGADGRTALAAALSEDNAGVVELLRARGAEEAPAAGAAAGGGAASPARVALSAAPARTAAVAGFPSTLPESALAELAEAGGAGAQKAAALLCDAAFAGDLRGCHALLASGLTDVDCRDVEGATPLHRAAAAGSQHVVELLLGHGAAVNVFDNANCSPLHYAAFMGQTNAAHALLAANADQLARNKDGLSAFEVARMERKQSVIKLLRGTFTRAGALDFSFGVAIEGEVRCQRSKESFASSVFRWKRKYGVLSTAHRALFTWSGGANGSDGAIMRLSFENIAGVELEATGSVFTVRVKTGPALVMCTSSRAESQLWVGAINKMFETVPLEVQKSALLLELLSDGSARVNLRKKFNRKERKAREALLAARAKAAKRAGPMSEGAAIIILQRAMRGHAARNMVRGWVQVKDPENGDRFYYNINTGKSEWKAPWHVAKPGDTVAPGSSSGGGGGAPAPAAGAPAPSAEAPALSAKAPAPSAEVPTPSAEPPAPAVKTASPAPAADTSAPAAAAT